MTPRRRIDGRRADHRAWPHRELGRQNLAAGTLRRALPCAPEPACPARAPRFSRGPAPEEQARAAPVLAALPDAINLVGQLTLPEAAACLRRCAIFIGNDSGLMHIAAAAGTPTLGLFGRSRAAEYAPAGLRTAVAVAPGPAGEAPDGGVDRGQRSQGRKGTFMRLAQIMAGAPNGGAELFFERMTAALATRRAGCPPRHPQRFCARGPVARQYGVVPVSACASAARSISSPALPSAASW